MQDDPSTTASVPDDVQLDQGVLLPEAEARSGDTDAGIAPDAASDELDDVKEAVAEGWERMRGIIGPF
jgi:hypothetical protein